MRGETSLNFITDNFEPHFKCSSEIIIRCDEILMAPLEIFDRIELCDPGELYTWGKGRYGRLGHGDSEDQLRPKLVESLLGYRVIDVACGELTTTVLYAIGLIDGT